jgi:DUF2950 family protein
MNVASHNAKKINLHALAIFAASALCAGSLAAQTATPSDQTAPTDPAPLKHQAATPPAGKRAVPAPQPGQQTYPTCEAASQALVAALQSDDPQAMLKVLGPSAKDIVSSGDATADKEERRQIADKFKQMHRLVMEPNGTTTLYIGAENWPTPIPLLHKGSDWYFDTAAGKQEILYRRVGRNELAVIQVSLTLVDAEKEYYAQPHDGEPASRYAEKFFSDPGKHNGLYWKVSSGDKESPIGPLVAAATAEGYPQASDSDLQAQPYEGYYFRMLQPPAHTTPKAQNASTSSRSMMSADAGADAGFAFIAYPAKYRDSGVMTFLVDQNGVVYEKDLGPKTAELAKSMTRYHRDATWHQAQLTGTDY